MKPVKHALGNPSDPVWGQVVDRVSHEIRQDLWPIMDLGPNNLYDNITYMMQDELAEQQ